MENRFDRVTETMSDRSIKYTTNHSLVAKTTPHILRIPQQLSFCYAKNTEINQYNNIMDYSHSHHAPDRTTFDEHFEALCDPSRRRILTALIEANPRGEAEFAPPDFTREEQCEADLGRLYHIHLPKLDDAGFIKWNPDKNDHARSALWRDCPTR